MIPVFYDDRMSVGNDSYSPSAGKPRLVFEDWVKYGLKIFTMPVRQALRPDPYLAHDSDYVDGVLKGLLPNGFENTSETVAIAAMWQVGSLCSAALHMACAPPHQRRLGMVACSPSSGFHHAHYSGGHGYCTFNGLIVATQLLRTQAGAKKVAIIDLDQHVGDGTLALIERLGMAGWVSHTQGDDSGGPDKFLATLAMEVKRAIGGADIALYQAGADMHVHDPLGGTLTTEQMRRRDRIVFLGVPRVRGAGRVEPGRRLPARRRRRDLEGPGAAPPDDAAVHRHLRPQPGARRWRSGNQSGVTWAARCSATTRSTACRGGVRLTASKHEAIAGATDPSHSRTARV